MVNTVILGFLIFTAITLLYDIHKNRINSGKKFVLKKDNYTTILIMDKSIPRKDDQYISAGVLKFSGKELVKSCNIAMKAVVNVLSQKHRIIQENGPWSISPCYFVFLSTEKFNKLALENNYEDPKSVNVLSTLVKNKYLFDLITIETPVIFLRTKDMLQISEKGGIVLHELVHVISMLNYDHWDSNHSLWESVEYKRRRKSLDKILSEEWLHLFKTEYK